MRHLPLFPLPPLFVRVTSRPSDASARSRLAQGRVAPGWAPLLKALCCLVLVAGFTVVTPSAPALAASGATISNGVTYQTIDGFGVSEAFEQAPLIQALGATQRRQVLDLLFSASDGAGLSIVRNRIGSTSTTSIEPNSPGSPSATPTYVWDGSDDGQVWFSQQAQNYGVRQFYADSWSAPGYMKTNGSESNGGDLCGAPGASACSTGDWRQAYANYLTQYVRDYQGAGVPVTALGFVNEPDYTATYSSMNMTGAQDADFINTLAPTLAQAGFSPRIVCCDNIKWSDSLSDTGTILNDANAAGRLGVASGHGYNGAPTANTAASGAGKRVWETEWSTFENWDTSWDDGSNADGFNWADNIMNGLTSANLNAFFYWWGAASTTDNEELINLNNNSVSVASRLWAFANYSRFIRPGATRIGATSDNGNIKLAAFENADGSTVIVALNMVSSDTPMTFSLSGLGGSAVTPYLTNAYNATARQGDLPISGGAFSATVPSRSLVTYVIPATPVVAVDCGAGAISNFAGDFGASGGTTYTGSASIDTSGVDGAAPEDVYQTERYGSFTYTFGGLTPNARYTVRLHEAELYWSSSGQRLFNVSANGVSELTSFDIYDAAQGQNRAVTRDFPVTADGSGQIALQFTSVRDNAKCSGIEIFGGAPAAANATAVDDSAQGGGANQFSYQGSWGHCTNCTTSSGAPDPANPPLYNGSASWDYTTNDTLTFTFTGTQVKLYAILDSTNGYGAISVDGGAETWLDFYAPTRQGDRLVWTSPLLASGTHTLRLRVTGTRESVSGGVTVTPDRIDVIS